MLSPRLNNPKVDRRQSSQDFGRVDKLISDRVRDRVSRTRVAVFFSRSAGLNHRGWKADQTAACNDEKRKGENPFKAMRSRPSSLRVAPVKRIV